MRTVQTQIFKTDGPSWSAGAAEALKAARAAGIWVGLDGGSLAVKADDPSPPPALAALRAYEREITQMLLAERRAIVRGLNNAFRMSQQGRCIHCGGAHRRDDEFVPLSLGYQRAEIHAACHAPWIALLQDSARRALGIDEQTTAASQARNSTGAAWPIAPKTKAENFNFLDLEFWCYRSDRCIVDREIADCKESCASQRRSAEREFLFDEGLD